MDYGNSSGISCFMKVRSRATCFLRPLKSKYDRVTLFPLNSFLLFPAATAVSLRGAELPSCQDFWGRDEAAVSVVEARVEACTVTLSSDAGRWDGWLSSGGAFAS